MTISTYLKSTVSTEKYKGESSHLNFLLSNLNLCDCLETKIWANLSRKKLLNLIENNKKTQILIHY